VPAIVVGDKCAIFYVFPKNLKKMNSCLFWHPECCRSCIAYYKIAFFVTLQGTLNRNDTKNHKPQKHQEINQKKKFVIVERLTDSFTNIDFEACLKG
jgi:hypothetical protein